MGRLPYRAIGRFIGFDPRLGHLRAPRHLYSGHRDRPRQVGQRQPFLPECRATLMPLFFVASLRKMGVSAPVCPVIFDGTLETCRAHPRGEAERYGSL
jgi:hypothetical protein